VRVAAKPDARFRTPPLGSIDVDRKSLRERLEAELEGEVRFRPGDRAPVRDRPLELPDDPDRRRHPEERR